MSLCNLYSIIAGDVGDCSVVAAPSRECHYVAKVTHLCVYVNHARNLKKLLGLSCVRVTKIELQKVKRCSYFCTFTRILDFTNDETCVTLALV